MQTPGNYATLAGLLKATERVLQANCAERRHFAGQSRGMWLTNAEYAAKVNFRADEKILALREKYAVTRPQDLTSLTGGHSVFGVPLPTRDYAIGDNVPGVGEIKDKASTKHGEQVLISGEWYLLKSLLPT